MELKLEVSDEKIRGLLCSAFEGGSNYWYRNLDWECDDENITAKDLVIKSEREHGADWHWPYVALFRLDCRLTLESFDDDYSTKKIIITHDKLKKGLSVMSHDHPRHFADVVSDQGDAITGDVFLQCVCFGEVIYG